MTKRVVLAYSGGLDTSVAVRWMIEEYGVDVIAVACDVGQEGTFEGLTERARAAGAVEAIVVDCTEEYARDFVAPAMAHYRAGDVEGALETFLDGVGGSGGRDALERALPEAFAAAVADASAFFEAELLEVQTWPFSSDEAARVTQPALLVLGSESVATFRERRDLLLAWLPNAEPLDLPGTSHLLLHVEPRHMHERLDRLAVLPRREV